MLENKASYAMGQAAALLNDPTQTWATSEYLKTYLQLAQDTFIVSCLNNPEMKGVTAVVEIANVATDLKDLGIYFADGQPLERLTGVISIKERPTSDQQEISWTWLDPARDLPAYNQGAFNKVYVWNGETILLPGATQANDLRIFGKFRPGAISSENSSIVPGTSAILAYATAGIVAKSRGNRERGTDCEMQALALQQSFIADAIMEIQAARVHTKGFSGARRLRVF